LKRSLSQFILFKIFKWKIDGAFPKELQKYIIIVAPHTHWYDFILGVLIKYVTELPSNFIGKASLFKKPFGFIFKAIGGVPVQRNKNNNLVASTIDIFNSREKFVIALAPEGTRKKVEIWKSGFYHIAKGANIPIVRVIFDFQKKIVSILPPFNTTDNMENDLKELRSVYKDVKGKIPKYS
jgi:1-acyl-sn-glycerol-3-phosphate acyltransferase